ncbi:MAG: xylulokinase [Anaerolineales bacterium]
MTDYLLGLDAGTTSVKAALFDDQGRCLGLGREEYQLHTPSAEQAELDAEIYWQSSIKAIHTAIEQAAVDPVKVRAIGVSSQGETTIALDAQGRQLRPAIVWLDNRSAPQAERLGTQFNPQEVYEMTGVPEIIPTWSACKILWIRENEPRIFEQVHKFLLVKDYLIYRLSGEYVTDGAIACTTMLYDIRHHTWWGDMLGAVGISANQLPAITGPGEASGQLSASTAELLGLKKGTLVINGGMDQAAGAVGAGSISPEIISETTGAATVIHVTTPYPDMRSQNRIPLCVHNLPGLYLFEPNLPTGGMAFKWFRDVFGESESQTAKSDNRDVYDLLTELAASIPPGSDGLVMLPHLMGAYSPEENPAARGVFSGFTLRHGKGHFVRAILEGVAYNLHQILIALNEVGLHFSEVRTGGGGARSPLWNQIKADVCGLPIATLNNEETGLLGDAILAGAACGIFTSVDEACARMVTIKKRIQPSDQRAAYLKGYQRYDDLNRCLGPYFRSNYSG